MTNTAAPPSSAEPQGDDRPAINAEWFTRMRSEKPDFLRRLFEVFLTEEPKRLAALCEAVAERDLEQVRFLAHSLKGAAATMGMERLRDACRGLEFAAKDDDTAALTARMETVTQEMTIVFAVMQDFTPNI